MKTLLKSQSANTSGFSGYDPENEPKTLQELFSGPEKCSKF